MGIAPPQKLWLSIKTLSTEINAKFSFVSLVSNNTVSKNNPKISFQFLLHDRWSAADPPRSFALALGRPIVAE